MSAKNGYVKLYKFYKNGVFWLDAPNTPHDKVGDVTELVCKKYIQDSNPLYYVELSGSIMKKIINYVPCLKDPSDETKPIEKITNWELPSLLEKISIEANVIKEYKPKTMPNKKLSIVLRQLELKDGVLIRKDGKPYEIKYNGNQEAYLLKNVELIARKLEEKTLVKPDDFVV